MSTIKTLYPLSSANGASIPLEVIRPENLRIIDVTAAPMGAAITHFTANANIAIFSNIGMKTVLVRFSSTVMPVPVADTDYANTVLLRPLSDTIIIAPDTDFSAITLSGTTQLIVGKITKWDALTLNQFLDQG